MGRNFISRLSLGAMTDRRTQRRVASLITINALANPFISITYKLLY